MQAVKRNRRRSCMAARSLLSCVVLPAGALMLFIQAAHAETSAENELFESKIRPLLVDRCQKCHGAKKQWSGLRLDSRAAALAGGDSGPAVIPGQPGDSEIVRRITDEDDEVRMPPIKEGKRFSSEQINALKMWIQVGAPWPESTTNVDEAKKKLWSEHWAFKPLKHVEPPQVHDKSRVRNPVDHSSFKSLKRLDWGCRPRQIAARSFAVPHMI
jgi:hypothetical protein